MSGRGGRGFMTPDCLSHYQGKFIQGFRGAIELSQWIGDPRKCYKVNFICPARGRQLGWMGLGTRPRSRFKIISERQDRLYLTFDFKWNAFISPRRLFLRRVFISIQQANFYLELMEHFENSQKEWIICAHYHGMVTVHRTIILCCHRCA